MGGGFAIGIDGRLLVVIGGGFRSLWVADLVWNTQHDMLDISPGKKARFVRNFMDGQSSIADAISSYVAAVKEGSFPGPEHGY